MCCLLRNALCLLIALVCTGECLAQAPRFPYKARITASEAYVRSGGGENFYPTMVLKKDSVVAVRRHDPGGWYKIDPPKGSFSWIATTFVKQTSEDTGVVTKGGAIVSVGSQFGDETTVWQRSMLEGEEVHLLGQQIVETAAGPRKMYRIAPPAREYRWISGKDILPTDQRALASRDTDPYAVPSNIIKQNEQRAATDQAAKDHASVTETDAPKYSPSRSLARLQNIKKEKLALLEIDREFRVMLLGPPSGWKLDQIEQKYQQLQDSSTYPPLAGQIDLRYPAINRYRVRKAEFDDFHRLTSQTEKRDAQLLASQYGLPSAGQFANSQGIPMADPTMIAGISPLAGGSVTGPIPSNIPLMITDTGTTGMIGSGVFAAPAVESPVTLGPTVASTDSPSVMSTTTGPSSNQQIAFVGAGFVQRGVTSSSEYVLMSPAGKILAHLNPSESVDLEEHIGQSVGIKGNRFFDAEASTDRINVSGLERVRLRQ